MRWIVGPNLAVLLTLASGGCIFGAEGENQSLALDYNGAFSTLAIEVAEPAERLEVVAGEVDAASVSAGTRAVVGGPGDHLADVLLAFRDVGDGRLVLRADYAGPYAETFRFTSLDVRGPRRVALDIDAGVADVRVPAWEARVDVTLGEGNVALGTLGRAIIDIGVGDIDVIAASAHAHTDVGSIHADLFGDADIRVNVGSVEGRLFGGGKVEVGVGDITLDIGGAFPSLTLASAVGDVVLSLPKGGAYSLELKTDTGSIEVSLADLSHEGDGDVLADTGGGGSKIVVEVSVGDIEIKEIDEDE